MLTVSPNTLLTINADDAEIVSQASIDYNIIELEVDNIEFATSQFVSVQEFEARSVDISPNPTSDYLIIAGLDNYNPQYRIIDITGKSVLTGNLEASQRICVSEIEEGIYLIELVDGNKLAISKFVVQH
ncbi:MAG: T9SS type A sorting domain-containing protein [Flavobacteriales bacterium]|nr:T9SS type A sorting domain-containing protein [Flavobacteriales bacterium]